MCRTNASLHDKVLCSIARSASDHVEIRCSVRYSGIWTPVFLCAPHLSGPTFNQTTSHRVLHRRVITASDIEDFAAVNCSMTFTLQAADYRTIYSEVAVKPDRPVYEFVWNASAIRIVNASSKCIQMRLFICLCHMLVEFYATLNVLKGILHSLTLRNEISSTHRSCYFLQRVKDL